MSTQPLPPVEIPAMDTGNLVPILHQVRHALEHLLETGEPTVIDLRSLPLAPGEERRLESLLGEGEVEITLHALGTSHITETRYSGVWLVVHRNSEGEVIGKSIEIDRVPALVAAPREEMTHALSALERALDFDEPGGRT